MVEQGAPKRDLESRLIDFAILVVKLAEKMPMTPAGKYYAGQLLRSGGSAALNYGESQGGETHRDFTHKLKIVFKEVKESHVCLRIIKGGRPLSRRGSGGPHVEGGGGTCCHLHSIGQDRRAAKRSSLKP